MSKIIYTTFLSLLLLGILAGGAHLAQAQTPFVPKLDYSGFVKCDGVLAPKADEPDRQRVCNFSALMDTVIGLINWLFVIAVPIAAALFAYSGLLYLSGTPGNITKAKSVFTSVGKGFIIMIVAWLAVYSVVNWVISPYFKDAATALIEQKK